MTQNGAGTPAAGSSSNSRVAWLIIGVLVLLVVALVIAAGVVGGAGAR
jgi:hypothetical protein